jgi:hypothetical protein
MLVVKSVPRAVRSKSLFAALSVLLMIAATLFGANVASGDEVWNQSYPRGSQSEACVAQVGETPWQDSWGTNPGWSPSWEQWANNGQGGWVCSRSITWAQTPVPASSSSGGSSSVTYAVGDTGPGGGTVFYVDMSRSAGSQFWEVGSDLGTAAWGCYLTDISGAAGTAIGTGAANTTAITSGCATAGIAARVASATAGGYSDWYLPSQDELNQLCKYARTQSTAVVDQAVPCNGTGTLRGGFAGGLYWSSSQDVAASAWNQRLGDGFQFGDDKFELARVRPVRAF